MSKLLQARHWPGCISLITPRRGGTEHGFFRDGGLWPAPVSGYRGDSDSARLGLIAKSNIDVSHDVIERKDPSITGYVATQLDFRGTSRSFTLFSEAKFDSFDGSTARIFSLFNQGSYGTTYTYQVVSLTIWLKDSYKWLYLAVSGESAWTPLIYNLPADFDYDSFHRYAAVVNLDDRTLALYIDGSAVAVTQINFSGPLGFAYPSPYGGRMRVFQEGASIAANQLKIKAMVIFNRALSVEQIAYLNN